MTNKVYDTYTSFESLCIKSLVDIYTILISRLLSSNCEHGIILLSSFDVIDEVSNAISQAVNGAGLENSVTSQPMIVMTSAPAVGHVFDGQPSSPDDAPKDRDFVTSLSGIRAFWSGFSTPLSPVTSYAVKLGTCPGCDDVVNEFDIGLTQGKVGFV